MRTKTNWHTQDDGVIPPQDTRKVLGLGLMAALGGKNEPVDTKFGVFRM
jgi:3-methylcrotonyl-CoA carboxylase beta subunit